MAVSAIARPIKKRCSSGCWRTCTTGDAGCCSSIAKTQAENMNTLSPAASIRYSGQWCCPVGRIRPSPLMRAFVSQQRAGFRSGSALRSLYWWCDELHHMPVRITDEDAFGKPELTGCQGDNAWRHQGEHAGAYLVCRRLQIPRYECGLPVHQVVGAGIGRERAPVAWR